MPLLSCTARTCVYNSDEYCSKGDIQVDGERATTVDETCCKSFKERTHESAANSRGCGCETIDVDCTAQQCVFNEQKKCKADKITITGAAACRKDDTKCGSFREK